MTGRIDIPTSLRITNAIKNDPQITVEELSKLLNIFKWGIRQFLKANDYKVIEHKNLEKIPVHEPIFEFNTWRIGEKRAYIVDVSKKNAMQSFAQRRCFSGWKKPYKRIFSIKTFYIGGKLIVTRIA